MPIFYPTVAGASGYSKNVGNAKSPGIAGGS